MIPAKAQRLSFYAALAPHSLASLSLPAQARRLPGVGTQLCLLPRCSEVCRLTFTEPDRDWNSKPRCAEDGRESGRRQGLAVPTACSVSGFTGIHLVTTLAPLLHLRLVCNSLPRPHAADGQPVARSIQEDVFDPQECLVVLRLHLN